MQSSTEIEKNVNELLEYCIKPYQNRLRTSNIEEYKQQCMIKFREFHARYPTLFFMIVENPTGFNKAKLNELLRLKRQVESDNITHEEATKIYSDKQNEEYIIPVIKDLSPTK